MYNIYKDKGKPKVKECQRTISTTSTVHSAKSEGLEMQSNARKEEWIKKNVGTDLATKLNSNEMQHVSQYQFRDYIPYSNIYTRKYSPEKQRVFINTLQYFKGHYIKEPYNSTSPTIQKQTWLRKPEKNKDLHHPILFKAHYNHERIISDMNHTPINPEPLNTKIYTYPNWRKDQPQKFYTPVFILLRKGLILDCVHHSQEKMKQHGIVLILLK